METESSQPPAGQARRPYSVNEEIAHSVSHGLGVLASIVALAVMVAYASMYGSALHVAAVGIYGGSLILLYTCSTLYHSIPIQGAQRILHILDHAAIYVLIAGSYTPFALISLEGQTGWWLFGVIWSLALAGVVFKVFFTGRFDRVSVALYLAMGWLVVAFAKPVIAAVPLGGLILLGAGGLAYSFGALFYLWHGLRFNHTIWHVFVLAGSVLHFFAILLFVIPGPASG